MLRPDGEFSNYEGCEGWPVYIIRSECATSPGNDEPTPEPTDTGGASASPPAEGASRDASPAEPSELQDARDDLTVAREFIRRCVGAVGRDPKVQTVDLLELADHVAGIIERAHSK